MAEALTVTRVSRFEKGAVKPLIDDITLTIKAGSLTALAGADGAGKTTLMRVMAGVLRPQKGSVTVLGEALYPENAGVKTRIGYMPQKFGLYEDLSVMENFLLYADLFGIDGKEREERIARLLAMTQLTAFTARPAGKLSGGMKQKLGLACALLNRPDVLLLDEPTVGVDPLSKKELFEILKAESGAGKMTVVIATTYMDEAAQCDQVALLEGGRLQLTGTPAEVTAHAAGRTAQVAGYTGRVRDVQAELSDSPLVLDALPLAGGVHVLLRDGVTAAELTAAFPALTVTEAPARLEDGYLAWREKVLGLTQTGNALTVKGRAAVSDPVIRAQDIVRRFGAFTAVDKTSFVVHPGEIFGLLGPNGAGKTTTFRVICGLLEVSGGDLEVAGVNVRASRNLARSRLGYMSQKFSLYGNLTVRENLRFFAGAYGLTKKAADARIVELTASLALTDVLDKTAGELPGGMKQRLAMAAALIHEPSVLFLDEPTSGADVMARRRFWRWMTELSAAGVTIIVTTHFMEEAQYCDRLLIQDAGRTIAAGTPEAIRGDAPTMEAAFIRVVQAGRGEAS